MITEQRRQQLDGIVKQMVSNKEPDTNIQRVVDDFKNKYQNETAVVPTTAPQDTGFSIGKTITNIPSSAFGVAKGIGEAVLHPIKTAKALVGTAVGGAEKLIPGVQPQEKYFDAMTDYVKQRYGSIDSVKQTIQSDPVGFALDLSVALGGGGSALKGAGTVAKIPSLVKAGETVGKVGMITDPLRAVGKVVGGTVKVVAPKIGKLGGEALGITTGAGFGAIKEAFRNPSSEFTNALRGGTTGNQIVDDALSALDKIKENRALNYKTSFETIKGLPKALDLTPLRNEIQNQLQRFNVKEVPKTTTKVSVSEDVIRNQVKLESIVKQEADMLKEMESGTQGPVFLKEEFQQLEGQGTRITDHSPEYRQFYKDKGRAPSSDNDWIQIAKEKLDSGESYFGNTDEYNKLKGKSGISATQTLPFEGTTLDFSRSTISDTAEINRVKEIVETVKDWGNKKGDLTPYGVDILKRRLGDFYSPSSQARAIVATLYDKTKSILNKNVEGYSKMTSKYAEVSDLIKDMRSGLSIGGTAGTDTVLRKLTSVLRQNNEFREQLLSELQKVSGTDIKGKIAGTALSPIAPKGLARVGAEVLTGGALISHLNPAFLSGLVIASPRIVGEFIRALGLSAKEANNFMELLKKYPVSPALKTGYYGQQIQQTATPPTTSTSGQ